MSARVLGGRVSSRTRRPRLRYRFRDAPAPLRGYLSDLVLDLFLGECLSKSETSFWADAGTATVPFLTMSLASIFFP